MARIIPAFKQYFDGNGNPLIGGYLRFLVSGSNNTNKTTYSNSAKTLPNTNPVLLDGEGRCPDVFGDGSHNVISYDSNMQQIEQFDPVYGDGAPASTISNEPAGNIIAIDVQAAINELDTEKMPGHVVATKTAAEALTPEDGRKIFITSDDGGEFTMKTGAAAGTYNDNGGAFTGTQFTAGDGSSGFIRMDGGYNVGCGVNTKWFGDTVDGVTDETAAIDNAIDYASSAGGAVRLSPGTHLCNITMKSNVALYGTRIKTILTPYTDTSPVITLNATASCGHFSIRDIYILGTDDSLKTGQHGIYSAPVGAGVSHHHFDITDVKIQETGGYGIRFESTSTVGPLVQLFELSRVHIRDSHKSCFSFLGPTLDFSMKNCHGQMPNSDTAGTYPVCEINGDGTTLTNPSLISCWFNHLGAAALGNGCIGILVEDAANVGIKDTSIESANPFIRLNGTLAKHVTLDNVRGTTSHNVTNLVELDRVVNLNIRNSRFATTGTATAGIKQTSTTMKNVVQVTIDALTTIVGATTPVDIKRNLTLSAGKVYYYRDYLQVDTEASAATDDLDYIYGPGGSDNTDDVIPQAQVTITPVNNARTVVVKHGTGNIYLNGGVDVTLDDNSDEVVLQYNEKRGFWYEISRCVF